MPSELTSLLELATKQGLREKDLIELAKKDILLEYYRQNPKADKDAQVLLDTDTGSVRLLSGEQDITPKGFSDTAATIARQTIIAKLKAAPSLAPMTTSTNPTTTILTVTHPGRLKEGFSLLIFWGYNLLFLFYIVIFLIGFISQGFQGEFIDNLRLLGIPKTFLLLLMLATPPAAVYYALRTKITRNTAQLTRLFFLLEVPFLLITYIPLSFWQEVTPAVWFFTFTLIFTPLVLYRLTNSKNESDHFFLAKYSLHQIVFTTVAYLTLIISFFTPLIIGSTLKYTFGDIIFDNITNLIQFDFFSILGSLIALTFGALVLLFVLAMSLFPYLILLKLFRHLLSLYHQLQSIYEHQTLYYVVGLAVAYLLIAGLTSYQFGSTRYLDTLSTANAGSFESRAAIAKELIPHQDTIKRATLDAVNARSRYLWVKGENFLEDAYDDVFNLPQSVSQFLQFTLDNVAYPFVYHGPTDSRHDLATKYQYVFGESLYDTYSQKMTPSVKLVDRQVQATTAENGLLATITTTEEFHNTSNLEQEVIYQFSLPEGSVVTDLKLGPELEFSGVIAPRGAAQRTYESQLTQRRDPALLEQTGPRQYRLRVFPIPGNNDRTALQGQNQRVEFTYVTPLTPAGYGLPHYSLEQNIDTSLSPDITLDGQVAATNSDAIEGTVNPCDLKLDTTHTASDSARFRVRSLNQHGYSCDPPTNAYQPPSISGKSIAFLYDVSSTPAETDSHPLKSFLATYPEILTQNTVTIIPFTDVIGDPVKLTPDNLDLVLDLPRFGTRSSFRLPAIDLKSYDAAFLLTSYQKDLTNADNRPFNNQSPLYIIHTGKVPAYTPAITYGLASSQAEVSQTLESAWLDFSLIQNLNHSFDESVIFTSPYFTITKLNDSARNVSPWPQITTSNSDPKTYLISAGLAHLNLTSLIPNSNPSTAFLDTAFAHAHSTHIVTPYASLIALVNAQQMKQLENESSQNRRFDESAMRVNQPQPPITLPGIPQPEIFNSMSPSIGGGIFGADLKTMDGGGGEGGMIGAPNAFGGSSPVSINLGTVFILANILLLGGGTSLYLFSTMRKKKPQS